MSRPGIERTKRPARLLAALATTASLGGVLAGCANPDLYWDRRETIALGAGDAIAANEVTQMVDPWPAQSGNKNIAFNGQKMQAAVQRYRTGKVTPPSDSQAASSGTSESLTQVNVGGNASPSSAASPSAAAPAQ